MNKHSKVLIVDDNARMREVVREILSAPNREFLESGNGEEAVALHVRRPRSNRRYGRR